MTENETTVGDLTANWPYQRLRTDRQLFREYLTIFSEELSHLRADIDDLRENFYVETADGPELTKLGQRVRASDQGFVADASETASIRYFILLQLAVAASDGTARGFENVVRAAFGDENIDQVTVSAADGTPELVVTVPPNVLNEQPTTEDRIITALNEALPCGTGIQLVSGDDIFTFRQDSSNAEDYEAGFGEGAWSG